MKSWREFLVNRGFPKYEIGERFCSACRLIFSSSFEGFRCPVCSNILRARPRNHVTRRRFFKPTLYGDGGDYYEDDL